MKNIEHVVFKCCKCGRFFSKASGGDPDIMYDPETGLYEQGFPMCKSCLKKVKNGDK